MELLLKNNKMNYIEQFLGAAELLAQINAETYKYIARVMMLNKLFPLAKKYLMLAKDTLYNDPELHYIFTCYYLQNNDYLNANKHIKECLKVLPDYYPAIKLSNTILNELNRN